MKVPLSVWTAHVARCGFSEARDRLRSRTREERQVVPRQSPSGLALVWKLIHEWPGGSPTDNRRKFAVVIRKALLRIKEQRVRVKRARAQGDLFH